MQAFNLYHYSICACVDKNKFQVGNIYNGEIRVMVKLAMKKLLLDVIYIYTVGVFFDGLEGTLSFYKDNTCLGVAFNDLQKVSKPLYPIVCSTAAKTEMMLGVLKRDFISLQDRCRASILTCITQEQQIDNLQLPVSLKKYIVEGRVDFQEN